MDSTLTDSIAAVEAAWDKVAKNIAQDPEHVIAATHGKRAVDNLSHFKPHLTEFEESILFFADAYNIVIRQSRSGPILLSTSRTIAQAAESSISESSASLYIRLIACFYFFGLIHIRVPLSTPV